MLREALVIKVLILDEGSTIQLRLPNSSVHMIVVHPNLQENSQLLHEKVWIEKAVMEKISYLQRHKVCPSGTSCAAGVGLIE